MQISKLKKKEYDDVSFNSIIDLVELKKSENLNNKNINDKILNFDDSCKTKSKINQENNLMKTQFDKIKMDESKKLIQKHTPTNSNIKLNYLKSTRILNHTFESTSRKKSFKNENITENNHEILSPLIFVYGETKNNLNQASEKNKIEVIDVKKCKDSLEYKPKNINDFKSIHKKNICSEETIKRMNNIFFSFIPKFLESANLSLLFYLFYKFIIELFLKHFIYLVISQNFNLEYFFVCLFGLCQSLLISLIYYKNYTKKNNTKLLKVIFFVFQMTFLFLFFLIQFSFRMSIWDHRYRLFIFYKTEIINFISLYFFLFLIGIFHIFNFCYDLDTHM
jgi:hypothetical protein